MGTLKRWSLGRRYVEVHMEQGPVLEKRGYALGPVAAIAGQTRLAASIVGTQVPSQKQPPVPALCGIGVRIARLHKSHADSLPFNASNECSVSLLRP